jgi:hypothetical protein
MLIILDLPDLILIDIELIHRVNRHMVSHPSHSSDNVSPTGRMSTPDFVLQLQSKCRSNTTNHMQVGTASASLPSVTGASDKRRI